MLRLKTTLAVSALALVLGSGVVLAQQMPAPAKQAPAATAPAKTDAAKTDAARTDSAKADSTWDQTKAMTRKEWNAAKAKWATEKVKWKACVQQAKAENLTGPKSWSSIGSCMMKS